MVDLISTKSLVYGTRRMRAGGNFRADRADARALIAVGAARRADKPAAAEVTVTKSDAPAPPAPVKEPAKAPETTAQPTQRRTRKKAAD